MLFRSHPVVRTAVEGSLASDARDALHFFEHGADDYYERHRSFYAPNVWPAHPPELRDAWLAYEHAIASLATTILEAMALSRPVVASNVGGTVTTCHRRWLSGLRTR